mgnify:CR=1 FL=1
MSQQDNNTPVVDINELKEIMDDDLELIQECFTEFVKDWPASYVEIKEAVLKKDAQKLDASAHKLKGTLRYLAAEPAADAAYGLELSGKENNFEEIDNKLSNLKNECQALMNYINNFAP